MYTLVIGLAVIVAAPAPKEAKKAPLTPVGEWTIESVTAFGMALPAEKTRKTIRFSADGTTFTLGGNVVTPDVSKFTHDPKTSPAQIDLEKGGMTYAGIYKIDGDLLTMCLTFEGERPDKFTATDKTMLYTMKRIKKD